MEIYWYALTRSLVLPAWLPACQQRRPTQPTEPTSILLQNILEKWLYYEFPCPHDVTPHTDSRQHPPTVPELCQWKCDPRPSETHVVGIKLLTLVLLVLLPMMMTTMAENNDNHTIIVLALIIMITLITDHHHRSPRPLPPLDTANS